MKLYSLCDLAREYFYPPCSFVDNEAAREAFEHLCRTALPEGTSRVDFDLYRVGEFDQESGIIISADPIRVTRGATITDLEQTA